MRNEKQEGRRAAIPRAKVTAEQWTGARPLYPDNSSAAITVLDDLPDNRCANAIRLLQFLHVHPLEWFVVGSISADAAQDLAACGLIKLMPDSDGPIDLLRVVSMGVPRR